MWATVPGLDYVFVNKTNFLCGLVGNVVYHEEKFLLVLYLNV